MLLVLDVGNTNTVLGVFTKAAAAADADAASQHTELVSHWRVDSAAAVRLTTATFAGMQADPTIGRAEALRRSMLAYIDDTSNPWNAYPDYWAPFSVVGEGGR